MDIWVKLDIQFLEKRNIPIPDDLFLDLASNNITDLATYFKNRFLLSDTVDEIKKEWIDSVKYAYENTIPLKPFATEILSYLLQKHITLALGTSNERSLTKAILSRHNISRYFSTVVTGDDAKCGKPNPDIFLHIADILHVNPQSCLVIEDSLFGVQAAKNACMRVIAVADDYSISDMPEIVKIADHYVEDLSKLKTYL
jgi:HAD superfamily hydrolase (TIGR01509 family)